MIRRRLTALFLTLLLLLSLAPAALADGETEIATAEDLLQLGVRPGDSFVLTRDIDMTGVDWEPVAFSGTLRGNGHTIYNLAVRTVGGARNNTVDGNAKVYDSVFAGFFSTLIGASVSDLTLRGVDINIESSEHCFVGGLTGYIKNSEIRGCSVLDARIRLNAACAPDGTGRTSCNAGVGGIAGFGSGTIALCRAEVTLVFDDHCDPSLKCEEFMGGILSTGNAAISDCSVVIDGYDACRGYAHNGGLVGMFYLYDPSEAIQPISGCDVTGKITFYEDNRDRRAYCAPFVGEMLTGTQVLNCTHEFVNNELFDYSLVLDPEQCAQPELVETVLTADCTRWGYTEHTCSVCGNTWRDSFVAPVHVPGEWEILAEATETESGSRQRRCTVCGEILDTETIAPHVAGEWVIVREAEPGQDGLRQLICADCGQVMQEEVIPAPQTAQALLLDETLLYLHYKDSRKLQATVYPDGAASSVIYWTSSDERVVEVDTDGTVHAVGRGRAVVTCSAADSDVTAQCQVQVDFTMKQWLTKIFRFGGIWY